MRHARCVCHLIINQDYMIRVGWEWRVFLVGHCVWDSGVTVFIEMKKDLSIVVSGRSRTVNPIYLTWPYMSFLFIFRVFIGTNM